MYIKRKLDLRKSRFKMVLKTNKGYVNRYLDMIDEYVMLEGIKC